MNQLKNVVYAIGFSCLMFVMNLAMVQYDKTLGGLKLSMINFIIGCIGSIMLSQIVKRNTRKNINTRTTILSGSKIKGGERKNE